MSQSLHQSVKGVKYIIPKNNYLTHLAKRLYTSLMSRMTVKPSVRAYLAEIGARGGRKRSAAKTEAARRNARKPRQNRRKEAA